MAHDQRPIRLRYPATCSVCARPLEPGDRALWDRAAKQAQCETHEADGRSAEASPEAAPPAADESSGGIEPTSGAGESARREYERRRANREKRIREKHRTLGGLILALTDDPQSTRAWAVGAEGERKLGAGLDQFVPGLGTTLHDRRIPGTRANIDHIVVVPAGVFVVDAKNYRGKVEKRDVGGWFRRDERLYVGGRDRSGLVEGVRKQVTAVRESLDEAASSHVLTTGLLCFVDSDWPLLARPIQIDDVVALWPRALAKHLRTPGDLDPDEIASVTSLIEERFPPA
jgi:hypothetical protein